MPCTLRDSQPGQVVLLRVEKSEQVHSIVNNDTWTRMDVALPAASRQQASYTKPELAGQEDLTRSLSFGLDNELQK